MTLTIWLDQSKLNDQHPIRSHSSDQSDMTKILPRGDGYGSRGVWQRRRVKQLLVADELTDLVCETLWPRLVDTDWGIQTLWLSIVVLSSRRQIDLCNDLPLLPQRDSVVADRTWTRHTKNTVCIFVSSPGKTYSWILKLFTDGFFRRHNDVLHSRTTYMYLLLRVIFGYIFCTCTYKVFENAYVGVWNIVLEHTC